LKNSAINGGVLLGKEYIFYIARLDPPLKGREFGEHPIKKCDFRDPLQAGAGAVNL